ncbi:hypothetical protein Taro_044788, partial [Colocasia esculenta]|nr:hypothetical protein [Colocasia esculenta]
LTASRLLPLPASWPSSPTPSGSCRGEAPTIFAAPPPSHHCRRRCFFLPCSAPAALSALSLSAFYSSQNPFGGVSSGRGRSRRRPRGRLTVLYVSHPPTFAAAQGSPRGGGRGRPSTVRQLDNPHLCLLEAAAAAVAGTDPDAAAGAAAAATGTDPGATAGTALAGVDGTEPEVPAAAPSAAASTGTLACSDPATHSGNNLSPAGSALLPAAPTAPLAAALADVATAAACTDACLHGRIASSTSRSDQHRLSLKKKKRKHSLDCPKGAGTKKTFLSPHSAVVETDTSSPGP